jgi:hypothetical protein
MRVHLRACAHCARHIRITEGSCPFCGAAVDASLRSAPPIGNASLRLRRAATVAAIGAAAGTVAVLEACSGDVTTANGTTQSDSGADAPPIIVGAAYGLANVPLEASPEATVVITAADAYGAANVVADATSEADAPIVGADAAYGAPHIVDAADEEAAVFTGGDAYGAPPTHDD